jgi:2-polyprenyl-3-methyl-5-hydroxy-6-metoxy-1,4-benzoquinol methylase
MNTPTRWGLADGGMQLVSADRSNGYEGVAREFMSYRTESNVGGATVREWARALPRGVDVLDLGCGHGLRISAVLAAEGANLYGVDASPTMIAAFRDRFPDAHAECRAQAFWYVPLHCAATAL